MCANPADRCYYCKQAIFSAIKAAAVEDGFTVLLDRTNASDDAGDRPDMRALAELSVLSPLRECGLTKSQRIICLPLAKLKEHYKTVSLDLEVRG